MSPSIQTTACVHEAVPACLRLEHEGLAVPVPERCMVDQALADGGQPVALARLVFRLVSLQQATALSFQEHHVVHEARRHPKVPRRLAISVSAGCRKPLADCVMVMAVPE